MKKIDSKIERLCDKLQYIVKYGSEIVVDITCGFFGNNIYRVSSHNLSDDIFTISIVIDKHAYCIEINNKDSEDLSLLVDVDNENAKNLMDLVRSKYENQKDKEKIVKIDQSLEILDRINDRIFKED